MNRLEAVGKKMVNFIEQYSDLDQKGVFQISHECPFNRAY